MKLFLDDVRDPPDDSWVVVRSYSEAVRLVEQEGFPDQVSFDHDLGDEMSGHDFAKYLIAKDLDDSTMPDNFYYTVHSANPPGRANIAGLMDGYLQFRVRTF